MIKVFISNIIRKAGDDQCGYIQQQVKQFPELPEHAGKCKYFFKAFSKRIQGNHVESKVGDVGVNKTMTDETVILSAFDSRRIKDQVIYNFLLTEAADRNKAGYDNNDECNSE